MTAEQNFARYRDAGDLTALAAVFDAVAGQLLLVAGHLVRDGALAEDLVQTTFVEAMRSAKKYDARRPLLPWLVQILTHHARKLHRRQRREQGRTPAPLRDERSAVEHVLDREAMAAIESGLARLSPAYQQVLTLRLVHNLSLVAIAHATGCPPETVKTRWKRGLEQLRKYLPAGLATSLAVMIASGRGLAAVRADVLLRAQQLAGKVAGGGTAATFVIGALMMKQFLLWVTVALVLLGLGWWGVGGVGGVAATPAHATDAAAIRTADLLVSKETAPPERQVVAAEPTLPAGIVFVGRCVADGTRAPLGDVAAVVRLGVEERDVCDNELAADPAWAQTTSGADGAFRLQCERKPGAIYDVRVGNREHVHRVRSFGPYENDQVIELGDVVLPRGVPVSLSVVDRRGAPVAGVRVVGSRHLPVDSNEMLMLDTGWPWRSDAQGEIHLPYAMLPGTYEVNWMSRALPADRLMMMLHVPDAREPQHMVLVWPVEDAHDSIEGVVVDEAGHPIPELDLGGLGGGTRGNARTLANGTFCMPRIEPYDASNRGPVEFGLPDRACGVELIGAPVCNWGDHAVRQVFPKDPRLAPSFKFAWDPRDGEEVVVPLTPMRECTVRVVTTDGKPVVGTELWTLQPIEAVAGAAVASGWQEVAVPVADEQRLDATTRWGRCGIGDAPLQTTRTGADGRAQVMVPAEADVIIAALGPGHVPKAIVGRATGDPVELRVSRGAALRLVLTPKDVAQRLARSARQQRLLSARSQEQAMGGVYLVISRVDSEQDAARPQESVVVPIAADGTCEYQGLPTGHYDVALNGGIDSGALDETLVQRPFGKVLLTADAVNEIPLDVSCWALGRLRGQVLVNGQPWAYGAGMLWWLRWPTRTLVNVRTDAHGQFEVEAPVEGEYRLQLLGVHEDVAADYCIAAETAHVRAGVTTALVFTARNVTARVRIVDAAGQPAAGLTVTSDYTTEPISSRIEWQTDADGWIAITLAPPVPFHLIVTNPNGPPRAGRRSSSSGDATLGPFTIPPTGDHAEFRAVLPADWR